jgi:transcription elongation factor GreA
LTEEVGELSLGEAASRYLKELNAEERASIQADINRFTRWFGSQRQIASLSAAEIENYAERMSQSDTDYARRLEAAKAFLTAAKKAKWTKTNFATNLKIRKTKTHSSTTGKNKLPPKKKVVLTAEGHEKLKTELTNLKSQRLEVIEEIRKAAADKDFRENVPFHAAREQKGHIDGRIMELEETLKVAETVDGNNHTTLRATIGNTVILCDLSTGEECSYILVNPREVDLIKGKISYVSPIGQAVIGKCEGETAEVIAPVGKLIYQVKQIK